ncbi:TonB family protein [Hymenobacter sp. BT188]|uniref:energy transducer TonB n=1 Tax=Hymenobacter sp. BT188 TaxID=2763504 RepID=UPI00165123D3|nr:energy transducer TonB [Hymenobacter sp. BT188]MBC6605843.1 TonB family protein [Hymenobacter sp. BT188]
MRICILFVSSFLFAISAICTSAQSLNSVYKSQGKTDIFGFGRGVLFRSDTVSADGVRGTVTRYFPAGEKYEEVHYSDLKKGELQGNHTRWFENGQVEVSEEYVANKRHGSLATYYPNGSIRRREQYQNGGLLKGECFAPDGKPVKHFEYVVFPEYPGGVGRLSRTLQSNIQYPKEALKKEIEGKVYVRFIVNKTGTVTNAYVSRSLEASLDAEALRAVNKLQSWTPGQLDGEAIDTLFTLPVTFAIE